MRKAVLSTHSLETSPYDKVAMGRTSLIKFIESRDDATLRGPVGASRCTAWITLICGFCAAPSTGLTTKSRDVRARYLPRKCADDLACLYRFCLPRLFALPHDTSTGEFSARNISHLIKLLKKRWKLSSLLWKLNHRVKMKQSTFQYF